MNVFVVAVMCSVGVGVSGSVGEVPPLTFRSAMRPTSRTGTCDELVVGVYAGFMRFLLFSGVLLSLFVMFSW